MRGLQLVNKTRAAKLEFRGECPKKFGGAAAAEILRLALRREGIPVSRRDVFVQGVPLEVDLVVARGKCRPFLGLLYEQENVAVALEVKKSGLFGEQSQATVRRNFEQLRKAGIKCAYVSFEERRNYKWKGTRKCLGARCFTLAWHKQTDGEFRTTGDWERLVEFVRRAIRA